MIRRFFMPDGLFPDIPEQLQLGKIPIWWDPAFRLIMAIAPEDGRSGVVGVQLEMQKSILQAQLNAVTQLQGIMAKI
jgi:hypothetical protein